MSDLIKGLIAFLIAVAFTALSSWTNSAHAKGHRFVGSSTKIKVPHVKMYRPHVNKGLRR